MSLPNKKTIDKQIVVNEVGPRDGLQNQAKILSPDERLELINSLIDAGLRNIEVGSFVSPKAVPAMAGTDQVVSGLPDLTGGLFSALVPNRKGYDLAAAAGVKSMALVLATSEEMNLKNTRMSTRQSMDVCKELIIQGKTDGLNTIVYLATAWECPFEGLIDELVVIDMATELVESGASEIVLADTIGAANPGQVRSLMDKLVSKFGYEKLSCHFHDTRGFGVANVFAAVESGIRKFDASIGGLGGCPFAPGASGNVATEDVVLMLEKMGYDTGISLSGLVAAADLAGELTGEKTGGNSSRWLKRQIEKNIL